MTTEPTLGELMRAVQAVREEQRDFRLAVDQRLDRLVSAEVFNREVARLDNVLRDQSNDLAQETANRRESIRQARDDADKSVDTVHGRLDKLSANMKWLAASVVLPIALFVATLFFADQGAGV